MSEDEIMKSLCERLLHEHDKDEMDFIGDVLEFLLEVDEDFKRNKYLHKFLPKH